MNTLETIRSGIARLRPDLSPDWMEADTRMKADLGLSSIDLLNLLAVLTQETGRKVMYEPLLLPEGRPRAELTLGELADFVDANHDAAPPAVVGM